MSDENFDVDAFLKKARLGKQSPSKGRTWFTPGEEEKPTHGEKIPHLVIMQQMRTLTMMVLAEDPKDAAEVCEQVLNGEVKYPTQETSEDLRTMIMPMSPLNDEEVEKMKKKLGESAMVREIHPHPGDTEIQERIGEIIKDIDFDDPDMFKGI
jgi:hypothetical protein